MEKQRDKTAKRLQRKLGRAAGSTDTGDSEAPEADSPAGENTADAE